MAAVLVLVLLAGVLLASQRPWESGTDAAPTVPPIPADASTRLTQQLRDLSGAETEKAFVAAAGDLPAARTFGRRTWRSLQAIAAPGAVFRYTSGGEVADRSDGSATATVEVEWRASAASGLDPAVTRRSTVKLRVAPERGGAFSVVSVERADSGVPIWLVGAVTIDRGDGRVVLRVDGGDDERPVDEMATTARTAVASVVPGVTGDLVIISPHTQAEMAAILGQSQDAVKQIAAVTTRLDPGTESPTVVVVLNPSVFATMDQRAAQVVLSHEATHALTTAVGTGAPNWVVEGFADYVALRSDTAPLTVSAGQILTRVAAGEVPAQLPGDADFGATQHGLGAVYESAWMIFRLLGERFSDAQIVDFYQRVVGGEPVEKALDGVFGLTVDQLTQQWRDYLTKSASTVS